jgi:hypothetical protein
MRLRGWSARFSGVCLAAIALSGCGHRRAKVTPEVPSLLVPSPPPPVVELNEQEVFPPVPLVEEPARNLPAKPVPRRASPESPRAERPPQTEKTAEESPPKPAATLQTTPTQVEGEIERAIRELLARAAGNLGRIDYRALGADARAQYDTAKRFVTQAEGALRARNLVFAMTLADKASELAAELAPR